MHTFSIEPEQIRNQNLLTILQKNNLFQFNIEVLKDTMQEVRTNPKTFKFQTSLTDKTKYFNNQWNLYGWQLFRNNYFI